MSNLFTLYWDHPLHHCVHTHEHIQYVYTHVHIQSLSLPYNDYIMKILVTNHLLSTILIG